MNTQRSGQGALARYGDLTVLVATFGHGDAELAVKIDGGKVLLDSPDPVIIEPGESRTEPDDSTADPVEPPAEPRVLGIYCAKDHFNDPAVAYCTVCGISMTQTLRAPEWGPRPQIGVLVTDDGTTHPLVRDLVVGRAPDTDPAVLAGDAASMTLRDPLVSRVHARVMLHGWQVHVTDTGSANGTFLLTPGQTTWTKLTPGTQTPLTPGSIVAFGHREIRYYSHRNQ